MKNKKGDGEREYSVGCLVISQTPLIGNSNIQMVFEVYEL